MTTTSHSYPAYKPSGVPWLGDVPEHWDVRRLHSLWKGCSTCEIRTGPSEDDVTLHRVADVDSAEDRISTDKLTASPEAT